MKNKNVRIGLFIDGNYLLHTSNYFNYIHPRRSRLSIGGLSNFIIKSVAEDASVKPSDCMMVEGHYFRGRLNATEASQRGTQLYNDRVFDDILMSEGIEAHYLPLRNLYGKKEERGVDVWLSLEAYERALLDKLDYVALVISDTDYVPLVRKLKTLGIKIILINWEFDYINEDGQKIVTKTSQELMNNVSISIDMFKVIEGGEHNGESINVGDLFVNQTLVKIDTSDNYLLNDPNRRSDLGSEDIEISEILSLKQGYGFIKYPNNNLFFHYHDVEGDFAELQQEDAVEFIVIKNPEGQEVAKKVRRIDIENAQSGDEIKTSIDNDLFDWDTAE